MMIDEPDNVATCYQAIGTALAKASRSSWDWINVDATLDGVRVDAIVSLWKQEAEEPVGYLTGVPRLASHIYDLARLVSTEEKGLFKKCYFNLKKDGKFDVKFVY
jgi:hypothetical protein